MNLNVIKRLIERAALTTFSLEEGRPKLTDAKRALELLNKAWGMVGEIVGYKRELADADPEFAKRFRETINPAIYDAVLTLRHPIAEDVQGFDLAEEAGKVSGDRRKVRELIINLAQTIKDVEPYRETFKDSDLYREWSKIQGYFEDVLRRFRATSTQNESALDEAAAEIAKHMISQFSPHVPAWTREVGRVFGKPFKAAQPLIDGKKAAFKWSTKGDLDTASYFTVEIRYDSGADTYSLTCSYFPTLKVRPEVKETPDMGWEDFDQPGKFLAHFKPKTVDTEAVESLASATLAAAVTPGAYAPPVGAVPSEPSSPGLVPLPGQDTTSDVTKLILANLPKWQAAVAGWLKVDGTYVSMPFDYTSDGSMVTVWFRTSGPVDPMRPSPCASVRIKTAGTFSVTLYPRGIMGDPEKVNTDRPIAAGDWANATGIV